MYTHTHTQTHTHINTYIKVNRVKPCKLGTHLDQVQFGFEGFRPRIMACINTNVNYTSLIYVLEGIVIY